MAVNKTVSVSATMENSFQIQVQAGNHSILIDQPKNAGGQDAGPNPLEYFLASVAGCIASIARIVAIQEKINLQGIKIDIDGQMNSAGLLGKATEDRVGFQQFTVKADIEADMNDGEKQAFLDRVCARCPVHDNIAHTSVIEQSIC